MSREARDLSGALNPPGEEKKPIVEDESSVFSQNSSALSDAGAGPRRVGNPGDSRTADGHGDGLACG